MSNPTSSLGRRGLLTGTLGAAISFAPTAARATNSSAPAPRMSVPAQLRGRIGLPSGVQIGDVTTREGVLWARADAPGRLVARVRAGRHSRLIRGPQVSAATDFTARIDLSGLTPGCAYDAELWFEDEQGARGETADLSFTTASTKKSATSFVWSGDTAGQGWGINPDLGGMVGYAAMAATRPDFFVHCGDTVYADGPIVEKVTEPDGQIWRNIVTPEVAKVAETLHEFRGRYRYNLMDHNVRAMAAHVPIIAQWDDHETTNNWYPGEILNDERYTEKRVDVLAARGRQAWQEFQPVSSSVLRTGGRGGFAQGRIYRKVSRGAHLDVFCLDMRTFKDTNTAGLEPDLRHILGAEQSNWLIRELARSTATWKVISADLPLGIIVPDGQAQESLSNGDPGMPLGKELEIARVLSAIKANRVTGVVWITADVHYCAAHHYSPERAAYKDFEPFWEFVAGPIAAGTFGIGQEMDATFGPEVVFSKRADYANQSPRGGNQFFGHANVAADGRLTITLRNTAGQTLFSQQLEPGEAGSVNRG